MSDTIAIPQGIDLRALAHRITPGNINFDPFGFVSGYKSYQITQLLRLGQMPSLAHLGFAGAICLGSR